MKFPLSYRRASCAAALLGFCGLASPAPAENLVNQSPLGYIAKVDGGRSDG